MTYLIEGRDVLEPLWLSQLFRNNQVLKTEKINNVSRIHNRSGSLNDSTELLKDTYEINKIMTEGEPALKAGQVMSSPVVTLKLESEITQALLLLEKKHIRHLPVVTENNQLVGIVSDRDIYRQLSQSNANLEKAAEFISSKSSEVITVNQDTDINEIAKILVRKQIGSVAVMANNQIVGIVTRSDLLETIFQQYSLDKYS